MMTNEEKEFTRRIKKMRKHTEALRRLAPNIEADHASVATIDGELDNLERRRNDPEVQALAHALRKGPKAVKKG